MKPYYKHGGISIYHGDCREIIPHLPDVDAVIADPPYGETSLSWDKRVDGWLPIVGVRLKGSGSLWCFGSLRFFMIAQAFFETWQFAQEIVWRKQNGSSFHSDRFKRVHEFAVQFYRGAWGEVFKAPVKEEGFRGEAHKQDAPPATHRTHRKECLHARAWW